jgi:hypothetical protein
MGDLASVGTRLRQNNKAISSEERRRRVSGGWSGSGSKAMFTFKQEL